MTAASRTSGAPPAASLSGATTGAVIPGLERLASAPPESLRGARVGLVTTPAAVDRSLRMSVDVLNDAATAGGFTLTRLFAPEHGVRGDALAGAVIQDAVDSATGIRVTSLYGGTAESHRPTAEHLRDVDVLVIDLQDVGVRFYTYQVTAALCVEAAIENGRRVVVLDRPNPIGGVEVEGPLVEPGFESFVGRAGQPVRHGLTLGELARAAVDGSGDSGDSGVGDANGTLDVVRAEGWSRAQWWDETGLPWVLPSPNLPSLDTATVYPGTCLFEGTLLSEGRGTTRPFEIIGAPWVEPYRWAAALEERALPGVRFRPLWFQPVAHKHAGARCGGVQVHVTDRHALRPVATAIHMIDTARRLWPAEFGWRPPSRPGAISAIDRLYGSDQLRALLEDGEDAAQIIATWDPSAYQALRQRVQLYD